MRGAAPLFAVRAGDDRRGPDRCVDDDGTTMRFIHSQHTSVTLAEPVPNLLLEKSGQISENLVGECTDGFLV